MPLVVANYHILKEQSPHSTSSIVDYSREEVNQLVVDQLAGGQLAGGQLAVDRLAVAIVFPLKMYW